MNPVIGLYGVAAVFGVLIVWYVFRILSASAVPAEHPRSWLILALGIALVSVSSVIEVMLVSNPATTLIHVHSIYFGLGNLLILYVLVSMYRVMEA